MQQKNLYDHIGSNNARIIGLVLSFPIILATVLYLCLLWFYSLDKTSPAMVAYNDLLVYFPFIALFCFVVCVLSFLFGDKAMLSFSGASPCPDTPEYRKVRRAVENMALAAGIPCPKVYLIDDSSLNAFATGYSPRKASVAFTTGIIEKLSALELDAVIAHEIAHITNRDIRLNMFVITGIGALGTLGEILVRSFSGKRRSKKDNGSILALVGFALVFFAYLIAPIIRLALSRQQEYQADARGAYLTRNPVALASALKKISQDSRVEILDTSKQMATACICSPLAQFATLFSTHPPIEKRIERLNQMASNLYL